MNNILDHMISLSKDQQIQVIKKLLTQNNSEIFPFDDFTNEQMNRLVKYLFCGDENMREELIHSANTEIQNIIFHIKSLENKVIQLQEWIDRDDESQDLDSLLHTI